MKFKILEEENLFFRTIVIAVLLVTSKCCKCKQDHPQTVLCNTDWAFLGRLINSENITDADGKVTKQQHTVYVNKVIKGESEKLQDREKVRIFTQSTDESCHINLSKDMKAIFTGMLNSEKDLTMNRCNWYEDYSKVPRDQRKNLFRKMYLQNCQCKIHRCTTDNDCKKSVKQECMWDADNDKNDCFKKYGYCSLYKGCGACAWIRSREFYNCEDGVNEL